MTKKIIASTLYPTPSFDQFCLDYFHSIMQQEGQFSCIFFLDNIPYKKIRNKILELESRKIETILIESQKTITPSQNRYLLIKEAKRLGFNLLFFSDFDEVIPSQRLKKTIKQIGNFDFSYNSFYPVDPELKKLTQKDFLSTIHAPDYLNDATKILNFNFIGLANTTLRLDTLNLLEPTRNILAYDWFLATSMLLDGKKGVKIGNLFSKYRQHPSSFVGIGKLLTEQNLDLGLMVKKNHYEFFSNIFPDIFRTKFEEILELELFLRKNRSKYIKIINQNFDPKFLCWWENIKPLKEIQKWI